MAARATNVPAIIHTIHGLAFEPSTQILKEKAVYYTAEKELQRSLPMY